MRKFTRHKENFVCKHCNQAVEGNGYTNHCPNCLYSLHVDKYPGDRQELCHGLMQPIDIITKGGSAKYLLHECSLCKVVKQNILSESDSTQTIINIMADRVKREMMR
jgi:phage FluMu protein Com